MSKLSNAVTIRFIDGDRSSHDTWQVRLKVDQQSFNIGVEVDTRKEALWLRRQLLIALRRLIKKGLQ